MIQSGTGTRGEFEGANVPITIGLGTRTLTRVVTAVILGLIRDGHLFLSLMADGGICEFEPNREEASITRMPDE
jgi:hypothetical protein